MSTLPIDPDVGVAPPLAVRQLWFRVLVVFLGGAVGTVARALVAGAVPALGQFPAGILLVNVVGSFLLGVLLAYLGRRRRDAGGHRLVRLALGTGVLGGFTTYSTVSLDLAQLTLASPLTALLYFLATLTLGGLASFAGILAGRRLAGWVR